MTGFAGLGLALSAASALGSIRQGQAQAAGLRAQGQGLLVQADFTRLQGRQEALKSKREAVNQLQAILEALARTTAVAGAGNIDPFSGNPEGIKIKALDVGGLNVVVSKENAAITRLVANFQASQFEFQAGQAFAAARAARTAGFGSALATLGGGLFSFGAAGGFGNLFGAASTTALTTSGISNAAALQSVPVGLPSLGNTFNPATSPFTTFDTFTPVSVRGGVPVFGA